MIKCQECGKNLGIFEGYRHPTLGKKHLVCSSCFNTVDESVERWRDFVLNYADVNINRTSKNNFKFDLKKFYTKNLKARKIIP